MSTERLETSEAPQVMVEAHGRLYVRGWDKNEVRASGPEEGVSLSMEGDQVRVSSDASLELRVPHGASLQVTAFDEATIRAVSGAVAVEQVGESLTLRDVGETRVQSVANDLTARKISGNLTVSQVGRFINIKEVDGNFTAEHVGAHANVKSVRGDVRFEADGNTNLSLDLRGERKVKVKSSGIITCRVSPGLDAKVEIHSYGPILVKVGEIRASVEGGSYEHVFSEGAASVSLKGDGPVSLVERKSEKTPPEYDVDFSFGRELDGVGDTAGEQISEHMGMIEEELEARLSGFADLVQSWDISPEKAERIHLRTQEKVNRAQEKIRRAQERAARKIADAQRRAEAGRRRAERSRKRSRHRSFNIRLGNMRKGARSKDEPVSDEERLTVLNMLAGKQITLEEAEALLSALEGD